MQKKHLEFNELFDVRAVRVITKRLQDCYAALGIVHTHFHHIPREFDDYVANPKPNGYQSIHTVVVGEEGKTVEIQIRTEQMHQDAELGVAAHWRYKEGAQAAARPAPSKTRSNGCANSSPGRRISRERLLAGRSAQSGVRGQGLCLHSQGRCHRPAGRGDAARLRLSRAQHDRSPLHRRQDRRPYRALHLCAANRRSGGGDHPEGAEPEPRLDEPERRLPALQPGAAKVATWFRKLDRDKNIAAGKELLEKELDRHNLTLSKVDKVVLERFHAEELEDLLAGIGSGDIRINQLLNYLDTRYNKPTAEEEDRRLLEKLEQKANVPFRPKPKDHIVVEGVGNLMTHIARCCQPIPGTPSRASSPWDGGFHPPGGLRAAQGAVASQPGALDRCGLGENYSGGYGLTIRILSNDRSGLLRDITTVLANEKINVMGVRSRSNVREQTAEIDMELEIYNINAFNRALAKLSQLNDVISAKRL
jgi:GTP pyrophosphokinase